MIDDARVQAMRRRHSDGAILVARSTDGRSTWGEWSKTPLRIAPVDGYLDNEVQTYVVVIDGPPDPAKELTRGQLWNKAAKALDDNIRTIVGGCEQWMDVGRIEALRAETRVLRARSSAPDLMPGRTFDLITHARAGCCTDGNSGRCRNSD